MTHEEKVALAGAALEAAVRLRAALDEDVELGSDAVDLHLRASTILAELEARSRFQNPGG